MPLWESREGRLLRTLSAKDSSIETALFGPDSGRTLTLLRKERADRYPRTLTREENCRFDFSPASACLAIGSPRDGSILLLRKTANGVERCHLADDAPVQAAREAGYTVAVDPLFSPDGRTLAAFYSIGRLILWDSRRGQMRHEYSPPHRGVSECLAFSPDSCLLAVSEQRNIRLLEVASGQPFRPIHFHWVNALAFAPDNRTLAVGGTLSSDDSEDAIHLWDVPSGECIGVLHGHAGAVRNLAFSPDGASLLSGGDDYTVLCWDVAAFPHRRTPTRELSAAQLTALWTDLASTDARRAQQAVAALIQAPATTPPFLKTALPPASSEQMAAVAALLADLDSEQFNRRERASRELVKRGEDIAPALRKTLVDKPSLEMRKRILALLDTIGRQPLSREWLRTVRALQALETIGTPQTRTILEGLSRGASGARLTEEAKAALQRLGRRVPSRSGSEKHP